MGTAGTGGGGRDVDRTSVRESWSHDRPIDLTVRKVSAIVSLGLYHKPLRHGGFVVATKQAEFTWSIILFWFWTVKVLTREINSSENCRRGSRRALPACLSTYNQLAKTSLRKSRRRPFLSSTLLRVLKYIYAFILYLLGRLNVTTSPRSIRCQWT